jgi:hypothetical protein
MSKYVKTKIGFNSTQIKNGHIVRMRKNGTIAAVLDTWPPAKDK